MKILKLLVAGCLFLWVGWFFFTPAQDHTMKPKASAQIKQKIVSTYDQYRSSLSNYMAADPVEATDEKTLIDVDVSHNQPAAGNAMDEGEDNAPPPDPRQRVVAPEINPGSIGDATFLQSDFLNENGGVDGAFDPGDNAREPRNSPQIAQPFASVPNAGAVAPAREITRKPSDAEMDRYLERMQAASSHTREHLENMNRALGR